MVEVEAVVETLSELVHVFDARGLDCADADRAVELFAHAERLCAAGKALAAGRAAEVGGWRQRGERSAAHWLARASGQAVGTAMATLETVARLDELPVVTEALRRGELSEPQLREVVGAAAVAPDKQSELVDLARREDFAALRRRCAEVRAAADDELQRHRRIHARRYVRHWNDADGTFRLDAGLTPEAGAKLLSCLAPFERAAFEAAREQGRRDRPNAYRADALVDMAEASAGGTNGAKPPVKVNVLIDHAALVRGAAHADETCEIAGVGRVPVATVRSMMADAFLAAVVTDGVDVYRVAHLGRAVTAHQRTALEVRDRECVVEGCHLRVGLEIDHVDGWARTRQTTVPRLARLCRFHHHQKTYEGWRLEGEPGAWQWRPPPRPPSGPRPNERAPTPAEVELRDAVAGVLTAR